MPKLTNDTGTQRSSSLLTDKRDVPFVLSFRRKVQKEFSLRQLEKNDTKNLQNFLDKVSQMTVQQVDTQYARKPDKTDIIDNKQVLHYSVTDSFRIHVIHEEGAYSIIRLDPNHKVHS